MEKTHYTFIKTPALTRIITGRGQFSAGFRLILYCLFFVLPVSRSSAQTAVSEARNSVTVIVPTCELSDPSGLTSTNSLTCVQYSDGLGRAHISVSRNITPSGKDLVSMTSYDGQGKVAESWLAVPMSSTHAVPSYSSFRSAATSFYGDTHPYCVSRRRYDVLYRDSVILPGGEWHSKGKVREGMVHPNALWGTGDDTWSAFRYVLSGSGVKLDGYYPESSLLVRYMKDEDGKEQLFFHDHEGKLILERKVHTAETVFYDTYYVYDDKGRLRYVLSPEASARMNVQGRLYIARGNNTPDSPLDQYGYIYQYDNEDRLQGKKLPGVDWIEYVYDKAGREVLSRDGNQRSKKEWSFTLYDKYSRVIQRGVITSSGVLERPALQGEYDSREATEEWTASGYSDTHSFLVAASRKVVHQVNYYDTYSFLDLSSYSSLRSRLLYAACSGYGEKAVRIKEGVDISTLGMLTGSESKLLEGSGSTTEAYYYDKKGRMIQTRSSNHVNGQGVKTYKYNFDNTLARQNTSQRHPSFRFTTQVGYIYQYDRAGRLTSTLQKVMGDSNVGTPVRIDSLRYDELGRVVTKRLHKDSYSINYSYNIRGQLTGISSPYFRQTIRYQDKNSHSYYNGNIAGVSDEFQLPDKIELISSQYTYDGVNRLTSSSTTVYQQEDSRDYSSYYNYDRNGNMIHLERWGALDDYSGPSPEVWYDMVDGVGMSYSGNRLTRVSDYVNYGSSHVPWGDTDFRRTGRALPSGQQEEYLYDKSGNLKADHHKGISWIQYNCLNLPSKIQMYNGDKTEYLYDASGVKRRSQYLIALNPMQIPLGRESQENVNNISSSKTRDYLDVFVFEDGSLKRILMADGYIEAGSVNFNLWKRVYQVKDHVGNVRLEIDTDELSSSSASYRFRSMSSYYPFGTRMATVVSLAPQKIQPYQVSGNELENNGTAWHDFHHRWYDQQLGRFLSMDPLAELDYSLSPYAYCNNNPINMIDPWGLQAQDDDFPSHYGPVVDIVGQRPPKTPFEESANRYRVVYNAGASGYYMNNADNIAPERKAPGMSREEQEREEQRRFEKALEEEGIKRGENAIDDTGIALGVISELYYSEDFNTWMGKDFKIRDQKWGGNKYTGGKNKFAKNMHKGFKWGGNALGAYGMYSSFNKGLKGEISSGEATGDIIFGAAAIYNGTWGAWANIWYNLGKEYGPMTTFLRLQEEKRQPKSILFD